MKNDLPVKNLRELIAWLKANPDKGTFGTAGQGSPSHIGGVLFQQQCGRCHGANLAGTFETPPLVGRFKPYWSGATLDVVFDYVATAMQLDHPGSLSRAANADIVAFILKANGFPAGAKELSASSDDLKGIRFDAVRPPPEPAPKPKHKKSASPQ